MRLLQQVTLTAIAFATINAQSYFEPANFDPTDALADLGVDISKIPELEALSPRADTSSCAIAVSRI
jgi:hypothetical protein